MDTKTLTTYIASIITTLAETEGGSAIATMIYLGLGCTLSDYQYVIRIMAMEGLVTSTTEQVTITDKGRKVAEKINAILAKNRG
jgi:predicted transcriptional regulator